MKNPLRFKGLDRKAMKKIRMQPIPLMQPEETLQDYVTRMKTHNKDRKA